MAKKATYDNESISSLKGADRVRKRPGVIFGSDGLEGCEHAVDVHFERQIHLHLPLPGVDRPFHDPRQSNIGLRDTHAPRRLRGVKRRIGSLLRREYKGNMLRHV